MAPSESRTRGAIWAVERRIRGMPRQELIHCTGREIGGRPTVPGETSGEEVSVVVWDGADEGKFVDAPSVDRRVVSASS